MINFHQTQFLKSAAKLEQFPPDLGSEIAIIGRSNSGKSSILNLLTQQKKLARVSKTPGRTQLINFFTITDKLRLVDLPGYGFAQVAKSQQRDWAEMIHSYLETRETLHGLLLIMDIRHPLKETDQQMLEWAKAAELRTHIILNKSDKLNRQGVAESLQTVKNAIKLIDFFSAQSFSALKADGIKTLLQTISNMYQN